MTGMLASVNSLEEGLLIKSLDIDIIDLKQPAEGALGALPPTEVRRIVEAVAGSKPVSATVGDLPMSPEIVADAVAEMAATGVDYVKIGLFPDDRRLECIAELSRCTRGQSLIAVLFADGSPDFSLLPHLHRAGFRGVMLDTMQKCQGSLTEVMAAPLIEQFVRRARQLGLICGLAGSLRSADIPRLLPLNADYLGFRGALCDDDNRVAMLNREKVTELARYFRPLDRPSVAPSAPRFSPV